MRAAPQRSRRVDGRTPRLRSLRSMPLAMARAALCAAARRSAECRCWRWFIVNLLLLTSHAPPLTATCRPCRGALVDQAGRCSAGTRPGRPAAGAARRPRPRPSGLARSWAQSAVHGSVPPGPTPIRPVHFPAHCLPPSTHDTSTWCSTPRCEFDQWPPTCRDLRPRYRCRRTSRLAPDAPSSRGCGIGGRKNPDFGRHRHRRGPRGRGGWSRPVVGATLTACGRRYRTHPPSSSVRSTATGSRCSLVLSAARFSVPKNLSGSIMSTSDVRSVSTCSPANTRCARSTRARASSSFAHRRRRRPTGWGLVLALYTEAARCHGLVSCEAATEGCRFPRTDLLVIHLNQT